MSRPFLSARWSNLCLISYLVPKDLLEPRLPKGLKLDVPPGTPADMGAVSLVAFDFLDTRVRGVRWPRHVNFPEINLRFYATLPGPTPDEDKRGVVFIKELVPKRMISLVARAIYNEPYGAAAMSSTVTSTDSKLVVEHRIHLRNSRPSMIRVTAASETTTPSRTSIEHWFKEHQWGFGRARSGEPLVYEVRHPTWSIHNVEKLDLDFDWTGTYGGEWGLLESTKPVSVVLAQGSLIEVHPKRILKRPPAPSA